MPNSPQKIRIKMYTWEPPVGLPLLCTASQLEIKLVSRPSGVGEGEQSRQQVVVRVTVSQT